MYISAVALGLVGLAAAVPVNDVVALPSPFPLTFLTKGFRLVVNVTDLSKDFEPPIHNTYITNIHIGAGTNLVGQAESINHATVFYQNGTAEQQHNEQSNVLSDAGEPPFPEGLSLKVTDTFSLFTTAHLDAGPGDAGIGLTGPTNSFSYLVPETWLACKENLESYHGAERIILKKSRLNEEGAGTRQFAVFIPRNCIAVRLLPECAELQDLPESSFSSHNFALDSQCYRDVKSLKWGLN